MLQTLLLRSGITTDSDWRRFLKRWLLIAAALHLVAAVFSAGWYHADEHFQIVEFLNWKLGRSSSMDLPLEFHERIRPWLQPAIYLGIAKALALVGIVDPFRWALGFRLASALVGWLGLAALLLCAYRWIPDPRWRRRAVMIQVLLWFMPALHARHSSENLSGSVMMIAVALSFLVPQALGWAGFLCGLAFHFRYQTGLMIPGLFLWLGVVEGRSPRELARFVAGLAFAVAAGLLVDAWGYHDWTATPWRYFEYNLVQGHVGDVDRSPLWDYFRRATTESWPLLGTLTLVAFLVAWARNPRHVLTWTLFPFFLVHLVIGHKELRFLFPMLHASGIVVALALQGWTPGAALARAVIAWNGVGLLFSSLWPAWTPIRFYDYAYHHPLGKLEFLEGDNPYVVNGIAMNFYRPPELELAAVDRAGTGNVFLRKGASLQTAAGAACELEFRALPVRLPVDRITQWSLFRCP